MAFTFLRALGKEIGDSICEEGLVPKAKEILSAYGKKLILPVDIVIAERMDGAAKTLTVSVDARGA